MRPRPGDAMRPLSLSLQKMAQIEKYQGREGGGLRKAWKVQCQKCESATLRFTHMQGAIEYIHYKYLFQWPKMYGSVYRMFLGQLPYVVVTGWPFHTLLIE
jgi:hypothetical protein